MGKDIELLNNKQFGYLGEKIAKFYLQLNQFQILKCNFKCKFGEIDIIAQKGKYIHFIEVKTRKNKNIEARESIDYIKAEHIWKCAEFYLYKNKLENGIQFDAVEIYIQEKSLEINYIPQIIEK